jgi:putative ABC transport system permease protein
VQQYESVVTQLRRSPDVVAAAAASHVPLAAYKVRPVGIGPVVDAGTNAVSVMAGVNHVSGDYFDVLDIRVARGRRFTDQDRAGGSRTIILNESAERALFGGASAVGKIVHAPWFGPVQFTYQVIGVVRDTKYGVLQDAGVPFAFIPLAQEEAPEDVTILARSRHPAATLEMIKRTIKVVAPDRKLARSGSLAFPGSPARLLSDQILNLLAPQRFAASLLAVFGVLALAVSAVGIYGHVAYTVSRRTSEIGIRMALGARAIDVLRIVSFDAGIAIAIGACVGIVAAALTSRVLEHLLYGVTARDPFAFASALGVTVATATVATLIPAWRAVRIDPARSIRAST